MILSLELDFHNVGSMLGLQFLLQRLVVMGVAWDGGSVS